MPAMRNQRVVRKFKEAGAIGPGKAVSAVDLGLRDDRTMEQFVKAGSLAREGDRYYIPEAFTQTSRWTMMFGKGK